MMHTGPIRAWLPGGRRMRTGPVSPILPPVVGAQPGPNGTIQAADGDSFEWATVINPNPLTIQLDGQTTTLPGEPSTLVPVSALLPYTRVWVQRHGKRRIVLGLAGGGNPWIPVTMDSGFSSSAGQPLQVKLDGSGLVDVHGRISMTGFTSGMSGAVKFATLPDGYWPNATVYWLGSTTSYPSSPYGGWISQTDGGFYIWVDTENTTHWPPPGDFSIVCQPWEPIPAQPY